ncbi:MULTISPECIES: hypothetical protein [unclassified Lysobacter]|uniref:hypothetical protein n=1 Tax=unclassified Lysobacter TaxID=2635362 RepID=UPI001BE671E0|nr:MULTISPECIES: hypothetical protein [unclassified Lysobacter]MBT2745143.1 hypothetical protein [Lysobacter sp. ISL-42]MBT2750930.1 hypothetical protein [Lysobacter sp. ISL-50]MBT2777997.1 hypothetical protein [Lysobacter sp. ISL-54]MBT2783945.1 hypothetical protein [Lysobacter sp. ISL-52]
MGSSFEHSAFPGQSMMKPPKFHAKQKKMFKETHEWLSRSSAEEYISSSIDILTNYINSDAISTTTNPLIRIRNVAVHYSAAACDALARGDISQLADYFSWGITFRSLWCRVHGPDFLSRPTQSILVREFFEGICAAGPIVLSQWKMAEQGAYFFIQAIEHDARVNSHSARHISNGTTDALFAALFSEAFQLPTTFRPVEPLISEYRQLLMVRNTRDEPAFRQAMFAAAEFHVSRSKYGTDKKSYEFEDDFDQVFPIELLAIQSLRRRDRLPGFATGHPLVDSVWPIVRDLPFVEHPLAAALEKKLQQVMPGFVPDLAAARARAIAPTPAMSVAQPHAAPDPEMKLAAIRAYLDDGGVDYFYDTLQNSATLMWVDHREDDADIVLTAAEHLGLDEKTLSADWTSEPGLNIEYRGKITAVPYPNDFADRDTTIVTLNEIIKPDYELRWAIASNGSDTLGLLPLSRAQWESLEATHPQQIAELFRKIAPGSVMFG